MTQCQYEYTLYEYTVYEYTVYYTLLAVQY